MIARPLLRLTVKWSTANNAKFEIIFADFLKRSYHNGNSKLYKTASEAIKDISDGAKLLIGGYGLCGIPENLIKELANQGVKNLTVVSNNAGVENQGIGILFKDKQISKLVASYIGESPECERQYVNGQLEIEFSSQGTLAERIRSGGAGIPAFFTPVGNNTMVTTVGTPIKYDADGSIVDMSSPRETRTLHGKTYVMEEGITADYALVKVHKVDKIGNAVFRGTARNFNNVMARAARITIVEADEIVEIGQLHPDNIHLPAIFVHRIVQSESILKPIENETYEDDLSNRIKTPITKARDRILKRALAEVEKGQTVILGPGLPQECLAFKNDLSRARYASETGVVCMGSYPPADEADADIISASKETVTVRPGGAFIGSDDVFNAVRGGKFDVTIVAAHQVSQYGDIASWLVPGKQRTGIGASMDLSTRSAGKLIVIMQHLSRTNEPNIMSACKLPLSAEKAANMIITDKAVFKVDPEKGLMLTEVAMDETVENIVELTSCEFTVTDNIKKF